MGDLISRSRLLDSLHREDTRLIGGNQYVRLSAGQEKIRIAPTVDAVEVVHGHWERVQVWKDNPQTTLRCSLCKVNQPIYEHEEWRYCPFCGKPMDGGVVDV